MKNILSYNRRYAICTTGYLEHIDDNDCSVRAIANGMQIPYDQAFQLLKKFGRVDGCGSHTRNIHRALMTFPNVSILGAFGSKGRYQHEYINEPKESVKLYKGMSVKTFATNVKRGTYIVLTTHHALVIRDGEIIGNKYEQLGAHIQLVYQVN